MLEATAVRPRRSAAGADIHAHALPFACRVLLPVGSLGRALALRPKITPIRRVIIFVVTVRVSGIAGNHSDGPIMRRMSEL